jgi:3-oxoacyl-[acyl-carrier protein] reductase
MKEKDNRIALVTGVSRLKGIGKAICTELAKNGVDIFFTYWLNYDKQMDWGVADNEPEKIQQEIQKYGVRCEKIELNLMEEDSIEKLFKTVCETMGSPSILINNATYSTRTNLTNITAKELNFHYNVNLKAMILLTARFIDGFNDRNYGGRIINLTSGQNLSAMSEEIAYAATKGAVETFTRTISHEIAKKNITINAVNPGLTDSGWLNDSLKELFIKRCPMGRLGQPEDAAKLIAFLTSENAKWITGQIINSEGGFLREKYD